MRARALLALILLSALLAPTAAPLAYAASGQQYQQYRVVVGPTPIPEGEANGRHDITLIGPTMAVAVGIDTAGPWGTPAGSIIDAAWVHGDKIEQDGVAVVTLLMNGWAQWPRYDTTHAEYGSNETAAWVKLHGTWRTVEVTTEYILRSDGLHIYYILRNTGSETLHLHTGVALSSDGMYSALPAGRHPLKNYRPAPRSAANITPGLDWVYVYNDRYALGLLLPGYQLVSWSTSWVDVFYNLTLGPGETRVIHAALRAGPDTCSILGAGKQVQLRGAAHDTVAILYDTDGRMLCWSTRPVFQAPPAAAYLEAWAPGYAPARAEIPPEGGTVQVHMTPGGTVRLHITDQNGNPIDAAIQIPIDAPLRIIGAPYNYTLPQHQGLAIIRLPPGNWTLVVHHGDPFIAKPVPVHVEVEPNTTIDVNVTVPILAHPEDYGWYSADLHHHSNWADGRTPPAYVVVAQSAAGLDFAFVSDHDYIGNYKAMEKWAETRGMPFIPSVEVSPGWGHFNVYPLPLSLAEKQPVNPIKKTDPWSLITDAYAKGAMVIRVNHPFDGSGYWKGWLTGNLPGPYCPLYTNVEINGGWGKTDNQTLTFLWRLWSNGEKYYLTAGSDTHDIFAGFTTGRPRVYAYLPAGASVEAFARAELQGHTYITYGPLLLSVNVLPGTSIAPYTTILAHLYSVNGLAKAVIVVDGRPVGVYRLGGAREATVRFTVEPWMLGSAKQHWVQLIAYDTAGNRLLTNPWWVTSVHTPLEQLLLKLLSAPYTPN